HVDASLSRDAAEAGRGRSSERAVWPDASQAPDVTAGQTQRTESGGEGGSVLTAAVIAQLTGGELHGDGDAGVSSGAPLDRAKGGQLSFCASAKYAPQLESTRASVVLLAPDVARAATRATARRVVEKP